MIYEFDFKHYEHMTKLISADRFHIDEMYGNQMDFCRKFIPQCCMNCSNHPENGGKGICFCTLGQFQPTIYGQGVY